MRAKHKTCQGNLKPSFAISAITGSTVFMGQSRSVYRFILLPSFIGLVCYSCAVSSEANSRAVQERNSAASSDVERAVDRQQKKVANAALPAAMNESSQSVTAYREAINLASSAYSLSLSAVSPDDWGLIASRWQRAADQLQKVNANSDHYPAAQQKMAAYVRHANHASAQIQLLQQSIKLPPRPAPVASAPLEPIRLAASNSGIKSVQVPITRRLHGTPVVQVTFNDAETYEMILDTGASRTLITRQMANELGVVATEKMVAATASHAEVTFDIGQMRSISIGEMRLLEPKVTIGDSVSIGLLGNDFLRGYDVTIRDRTIELEIAQRR